MTAPTDDQLTTPEEPAAEPKKWTLPELRKFDGQLFIQNNTPMKITFNEKMGDKSVNFELDPAGEPDSITFLPKLALDMRGLQKLWMKGAVAISTDPEMEDQIMLMNARALGVADQRINEMMGKQTESNTNAMIEEKACLVCGQRDARTSVITRGRVIQSRRQAKEGLPPLCPEHITLANQFVPRLVSEKGEEHWEFDRMQLTQTQR